MSIRRFNAFTSRCGLVLGMILFAFAFSAAAQEPVAASTATDPAVNSDQTSVSEAELHFRTGVDLYNRNLFLEALSEFNRALALDPEMNNARIYRDKANAKLRITAAGQDPACAPGFDVVDATAIPSVAETPQLTAEEIKIQRVAELLKEGELYLENQMYSRAVKVFDEVLLIAPDNTRAREGLHTATIGASQEALDQTQKKVEEDQARIRKFIEDSKQLPAGADPTGIKPYRISVPYVEEEYEPVAKKSKIEELLDAPIGIEFEDVHISEIIQFISETYEVNIIIDSRAVLPPEEAVPVAAAAALPGAAATPGAVTGMAPPPMPQVGMAPAAPAARPGAPRGAAPVGGQMGVGGMRGQGTTPTTTISDGMVSYINLKDMPLRQALNALLRPLNLDFSVQPGFLWISTPDTIRLESFEELETKYYELRNAGAETLYKIVLNTTGSSGSSTGGGTSGARGGTSGGTTGGTSGGTMGGTGGGTTGGTTGGSGGTGAGGGTRTSGGTTGGTSGGTTGSSGISISNISQMFSTISDTLVGETPAIIGTVGLAGGGTGATGTARAGGGTGAMGGAGGAAGAGGQGAQMGAAGGAGQANLGQEPEIVVLLRRLIPDVYEPGAREQGEPPISEMIYVPHNNQLIVRNTPTNLAELERQLAQIDITPKQVSIEAKFLTVSADDFKEIGFRWDVSRSDLDNRERQIPEIAGVGDEEGETYAYDINGDGVTEDIPFYSRPDGSNVIRNTISSALMSAFASAGEIAPNTPGGFSLSGIIADNSDGDRLSVVFDYLNSLSESELLSAPRVTTMNRKPAVIADIQSEYFVTQVNTELTTAQAGFGGNAAIGFTQSIVPQLFVYGIYLSVTPQISGSDQVRLWLNPTVRARGTEKVFTQRSVVDGQEITDRFTMPNETMQSVWTNVIVHDGDTLVLGGLVRDRTVKGQQKMPYLADIPVLGFFFRGKSREVTQQSLLIFVTPTIVDTTGARFFEANMAPVKAPRPAAAPVIDTEMAPAETQNQFFEAEPLDGGVAPQKIVPESAPVLPSDS